MVKKGLFLAISLLLAVGSLGALHTPALAAPGITLDPAEGSDGIVVTISGSGFAPDSTIDVTWNGEAIATNPETVATNETGSFGCEITVPEPHYGEYSVAATDGTNSAEATFYVLPSNDEKFVEGLRDHLNILIALPAIINEIADKFINTEQLRLTDQGNEFVDNMITVISDGAEYAAQWLAEQLGG